MRSYSRPLGFFVVIAIIAGAYFIGRVGRGAGEGDEATVGLPDPGYAARDAEVIETGYDGRERYRLKARVVRQQLDGGTIDLEHLEMDYHPGPKASVPGEAPGDPGLEVETWHLVSDQGRVRADGDDVQLSGNVEVTGPAPGSGLPLTLTTQRLSINTPREFISTDAPVRLRSSGNELTAVGMEADLKAGVVSLKSSVHGSSAP